MLNGIDVSGWQTPADVKAYWDKNKFCMIKATEGTNFKSDSLDALYGVIQAGSKEIVAKDKLYGFYHFAQPAQGSPEKQADWFLQAVGHHKGTALFALDWEADALRHNMSWALTWLQRVQSRTGSLPLFYISASEENSGKYVSIRDAGFPLWVAHWGVSQPTVKCWKTWSMWQYTDKPIDSDRFNGSVENWRLLAQGKSSHPVITSKEWTVTTQTDTKIVLEKC